MLSEIASQETSQEVPNQTLNPQTSKTPKTAITGRSRDDPVPFHAWPGHRQRRSNAASAITPPKGKENPPLIQRQNRKILLPESRFVRASGENNSVPLPSTSTNTSNSGDQAREVKIQLLVKSTNTMDNTGSMEGDVRQRDPARAPGTPESKEKEVSRQDSLAGKTPNELSKGMRLMYDSQVTFADVARTIEKEIINASSNISYDDPQRIMQEFSLCLKFYKQTHNIIEGLGGIATESRRGNGSNIFIASFLNQMAFVAHAEYVIYYLYNNRFQSPLNNAFLSYWTECLEGYKSVKERIEKDAGWVKQSTKENKDITTKGALDLLIKIRAEIVSRFVRGMGAQLDNATPESIHRKAKNKFRQVALDFDEEIISQKLRQLDMENHEEPLTTITEEGSSASSVEDSDCSASSAAGNKKEWKILKFI